MTRGTAARAADRDFVGRTEELRRLTDLAHKVRSGQHRTAVIRGAPGIGKSALISRFLADLEGFTVLSAIGDLSERPLELGIVDQLLSRVPAETRSRTPALGAARLPGANPLAIGTQLLELVGELTPVALVVDDLQWADHSSLQALRFLLRRIWSEEVLVVLLARSGEQPDDPAVDRLLHATPAELQLELGGLDLVDVADLARQLSGHQLPTATVRRFHSFTRGHPLLLRTILREVGSQQSPGIDWGRTVPPSVATGVRRRFENLPPPSQALLEALAVLGGRPSLAQAAEVAAVETAAEALGPAIEAGLAIWFPEEPSCPVSITHELQREAIYSALSPVRRGSLHQRAATTVEHLQAWRHRVAAVSSTDAKLARQLEQAAGEEGAQGNHDAAATFLGWAAELAPWGPLSEKLLLTSMIHIMFSPGRGRARTLYARATRCAPSALRSLALGLCELYVTGERSAAEDHLREAFEVSTAIASEGWVRGTAAAGLTGISVWRGDADSAMRYADVALTTPGVPVQQRDYVACLRAVARSRRDGLPAGLDELRHLSDHPSDVSTHDLEALACRGAIRTLTGLIEEAEGDLTEVVRRQEAGVPMLSGVQPHCYLAAAQYQLGDWDSSALTMRRASLLVDEDQPAMNQVISHLAASLVPSARGDWSTADGLVRSAQTAARRFGGPQDLRYAAIAAGLLCEARGDSRGVLRALSVVPGLRSRGGPPSGLHEWWSTFWGPLLIHSLQDSGELAEAAGELTALRERAQDSTMLGSTIARLAARQADAEGNKQLAIDLAEEQLRTLLAPRPRLADGLLFHEHGRRLLGIGDRIGAARWLTAADQCLGALSALPYRRRLATDLAMLTAEPVPRRLPELTAREREVTELVLRDLTNREIAAELFVSPKTVEYHLRNIFARLGIGSRRELRGLF
ncbi:helix-turn-helix transcriptional regulator [Kribbella sp. CA-293567]|uniref:helix-turn-helix transcriptional regulator n=1 Tax=Kribbella sp. CA-293567 TaxID=3002436 RepID=UPI0022DE7FF9|nr:LuxR family transcriptional regulator [Kribbella sp. CA-293567]WBQ03472.1 AAA family ATPase [Kribbella sp. CA-293567]